MLVTVLMVAFSATAFAKIGVLDFQKVLKQSEGGKDVYNKLQTKADEYDKKLTDLGENIKAMQNEYSSKESLYNTETKDKKRAEIQREIRTFNVTKEDYAKELKRLEMRYLKKIQDEVLKIVDNMGKELGYDLIVEQQETGLLYRSEKVDITDNVIKRYDNEFKQAK
jgi:outer membrane protein